MKYTILGAGSGLPNPDFHLSSLVVQTTNNNFLLDCGEGTARQLVKNGLNNNTLDAVLISHYHPDHVTGLYMLIQMLYLEHRTKPLNLFLPERPAAFMESMHLFYTFEQRLPYKIQVYEMQEAELIYPEISVAINDHLLGYSDFVKKENYPNTLQSFSISISENSKTLLYTSDINTFSNITDLIEKADEIVIDALHPEPELIINLAENKSKQLVLTHGITAKLQSWKESLSPINVEYASENVSRNL